MKLYLDEKLNRIENITEKTGSFDYYVVNIGPRKKVELISHYHTDKNTINKVHIKKLNLDDDAKYAILEMVKNMNDADFVYLNGIRHIVKNGIIRDNRTGVQTVSTFGYQSRYDLTKGFPLLTTKKMSLKNIVSELLWFINGNTNIKYLLEHNNHIWTEWAFEKYIKSNDYDGKLNKTKSLNEQSESPTFKDEIKDFEKRILTDEMFAKQYGELGPVYGKQWRDFNGVDQLSKLIHDIKNNPSSRRLIMSAWNPAEFDDMALPPCHSFLQFYVQNGQLSCQLYQRSADFPLGVPYNIASYSLLVYLLAKECGLEVGEFIHTIGDAHIYFNQLKGIKTQLTNVPFETPQIEIQNWNGLFNVKVEDVVLTKYESHKFIKFPVAI